MSFELITIGDAMKDIFIFPSLEETQALTQEKIENSDDEKYEKYLVFGLGDKITISDVDYSIGGTAANVAVGLAKIGLKTAIISAIGSDNAGEDIKEALLKAKVDIKNVKEYRNKKSSFSVIVSYKGERTIFVYHAFVPENFPLLEKLNTTWLYLGPMSVGYEKLYTKIVSQVIREEIKIAVNPGAIQIKAGLNTFGGLLKLISVIFLNREEAQELSGLKGVPNIRDLAKVIQLQGPETVVITDGKNGAYAYNGKDFLRVGAYPGHRVESTGAGDAFASGFLAAITDEEPLIDCLKWGVVNAASVIEKTGAQEGLLAKNTLKRRVKEYRWPADTLRFS